jgi:hypothetical protein
MAGRLTLQRHTALSAHPLSLPNTTTRHPPSRQKALQPMLPSQQQFLLTTHLHRLPCWFPPDLTPSAVPSCLHLPGAPALQDSPPHIATRPSTRPRPFLALPCSSHKPSQALLHEEAPAQHIAAAAARPSFPILSTYSSQACLALCPHIYGPAVWQHSEGPPPQVPLPSLSCACGCCAGWHTTHPLPHYTLG